MKTWLLRMTMTMPMTMILLASTSATIQAEVPPDLGAQKEAVRLFPDLGKRDSEFNKRFSERLSLLRTGQDPILEEANWPVVIAYQIGKDLALSPTPTAPVAPPQVAPPRMTPPPAVAASPARMTPSPTTPAVVPTSPKDPNTFEVVVVQSADPEEFHAKVIAQVQGGVIARVKVPGATSRLVFLKGAKVAIGAELSLSAAKQGTYHYAPSGLPAKDIDSYDLSFALRQR